jgi:signal peptidase I
MRTRHTKKLLSGALGLIVLGCLWLYFAPVGLGGSTTYVVTDGVSMEPRFHAGDLVLLRGQDSYHVGEIVAYRSKVFHTIVLHRIIRRAGARYVFKGDNNNFVDFEHPARGQLLGALWLSIPGVGARLDSIRSPALIGALVAIGTLLFAGAAFTRRQRRRRRQRRAEAQDTPHLPRNWPRHTPGSVAGILAVGLIALLPFIVLALVAFTRPSTASTPFNVAYRQSGTLSYSAAATPGPAYLGDRAVTGEPLFTHVISTVNLRFGYLFQTAAAHTLQGKVSLRAAVTSTSGWHTTIQLGRATRFQGDHALITARLDLTSLLSLLHRVETTTAVSGSYTLTLVPHVSTTGSVDVVPLRTTFSPRVQFSLNRLELQPVVPQGSSGQSAANPFAQANSGSATGRHYQPLQLSLGFARLSVTTARRIALAGIVILIYALLVMLTFARPRLRDDESAAIRARYSWLIVAVERVWPQPGVAVVDVADMEALVRIAEHYDRSILHEVSEEGEAFWVNDESGQFRYALGGTASTMEHEVLDESPPAEPEHEDEAGTEEIELGGFVGRAVPAHARMLGLRPFKAS